MDGISSKSVLFVTICLLLSSDIKLFAQQNPNSFPLEIGNKWYYQRWTNTSECFAVIKEVTDTLSNGFREITNRYIYRNYESTGKEYWGFIDGKFYSNTSPQIENTRIFYNAFLTHDSCMGDINYSYCLKPIQIQLFDTSNIAQLYLRNWALASIVSFTHKVITSPQIGIVSTFEASYPRDGVGIRDSTNLIWMYRNGEFLGDSTFYNPYRASTLLSPWDNSFDMYLTVKLEWAVASEIISYGVQVSNDPQFSNLIIDSASIKDTFLVIGPLDSCTSYYWRVVTLSSDGNEYFSSAFRFKTFGCMKDIYRPTEFRLYQNYPNPFYQTTKIRYSVTPGTMDTSSTVQWLVQIRIFNILGEEVTAYSREILPNRINEIDFNGIGLADGIYFYQLQAGNLFETKKMILLK